MGINVLRFIINHALLCPLVPNKSWNGQIWGCPQVDFREIPIKVCACNVIHDCMYICDFKMRLIWLGTIFLIPKEVPKSWNYPLREKIINFKSTSYPAPFSQSLFSPIFIQTLILAVVIPIFSCRYTHLYLSIYTSLAVDTPIFSCRYTHLYLPVHCIRAPIWSTSADNFKNRNITMN